MSPVRSRSPLHRSWAGSSENPQEHQHDNDQQDQAEAAAGVISPSATVGPCRECSDQQEDQNDDQDDHAPDLLCAGAVIAPDSSLDAQGGSRGCFEITGFSAQKF